ncbi:hypothetical protein N7457_002435 [Penicillium paradoxum]|uniref:uncharacterized protein n=1 Tax=Penicillium paradoxum TaxID=176176 RepID=UPI002548AE4F|nr:uncharacterized protein N7457_002435 [Penicillium paradoxum]KAJ5787445.1 hypothetical protein N7457_002435 [Penicillium paradoxum]
MRQLLQVLACLIFPLIVSAEIDPLYNVSNPFRPANVTGLGDIWIWVGSYYNGTTKIEFTPEIGSSPEKPVCKNLQGRSFSGEFQSFLGLTQRGAYNLGSNPVNILLSLWNSDTNLSSLANASAFPWLSPSPRWTFESSPWVTSASNVTVKTRSDIGYDEPLVDNFILNLSPRTKGAPYNLTGTIKNTHSKLRHFDFDLDSCNTTFESSEHKIHLIERDWWDNEGWNWTYPEVGLQFDSQTANLTVNGYASGTPYHIADEEYGEHERTGPDVIQGKIKITFSGVIDPYRSDTLFENTTMPTWLRTVGFQNNPVNIGYESGALGWSRPWGTTMICSVISLALIYS